MNKKYKKQNIVVIKKSSTIANKLLTLIIDSKNQIIKPIKLEN